MHVDDHTPAQSDADQQGPRDLERRYTIQHLADMEDAAGAEAGKVAKDPVVSAAFVLAESDRNKKRTNGASSIVQVREPPINPSRIRPPACFPGHSTRGEGAIPREYYTDNFSSCFQRFRQATLLYWAGDC